MSKTTKLCSGLLDMFNSMSFCFVEVLFWGLQDKREVVIDDLFSVIYMYNSNCGCHE